MKERIELMQIILMSCEAIAAFAGIICWHRAKDRRIRVFIMYLLFIAIAEQTGWYLRHHGYKDETSMLYTYVVIPIEFLVAYWFIYKFSEIQFVKKLCVFATVFGGICNAAEIFLFSKEKFFFISLSYIVYTLLLLILVLHYLFYFTRSEKIINYWRYFSFWVCSAYLVYYLATFPLFAFYNYLYKVDKNAFMLYWQLQMCLNAGMYLLFFIGLLWTNKRYK